jgi:hypothetical protein
MEVPFTLIVARGLRNLKMKPLIQQGGSAMNSRFTETSLHWRQLCRAASLERNPGTLLEIVRKINSALRVQQRNLRRFAEGNRKHISQLSARIGRAA